MLHTASAVKIVLGILVSRVLLGVINFVTFWRHLEDIAGMCEIEANSIMLV